MNGDEGHWHFNHIVCIFYCFWITVWSDKPCWWRKMGLFVVEQESHLVPRLALQWIVLISPNNIFSRFLFFLRLLLFFFCKVFNQYLATITSVELCELKTLEKTFSLSIEFQDDKFTISIYYREPQMWCLNEILGRENPQKKLFREREYFPHCCWNVQYGQNIM